MPSLTTNNDPNTLAGKLLDILQHVNHRLALDELRSLEDTVSNISALVKDGVNSYAPINTLPVEILSMVFMHALPSRDGSLRLSGYKDPTLQEDIRMRVTLTHVCRQWRQVALDMPLLWTVINNSFGGSSSAFLSRSREMPLQVCTNYAANTPIGSTLGPCGERIRDLAVTIPMEYRSVIPSHAPEFAFDAPNLESLSLITNCKPFDDTRPSIDFNSTSVLFSRPTPHLKMLILRNMCWLPTVPYESLTHLNITGGTPIYFASLLVFLEGCTSLEELVVVDIYIANATLVPPSRAISMPRLRLLVLGINRSLLSMRRLLQYLIFPPTMTLRVVGGQSMKALTDMRPFPTLSFTHTFDTLSIDNTDGHLTLRASGPSSGLLIDPKGYSRARHDQAAHLVKCLVPLNCITDLRYAAQGSHATHLLADYPLPALKRLAFVLQSSDPLPTGSPDEWRTLRASSACAATQALAHTLMCAPQLSELELWSADADMPLRLGLPECAPGLRRLVFHYTGVGVRGGETGEGNGEEGLPDLTPLRGCGFDVLLCICPSHAGCKPPLEIPGVDPLSHPYEW